MKIVIIGGTGLVGTKVVRLLRGIGHEVVAASPSTGVNAMTGEGLASAFADATVVVDLANSPSFENDAVLAFFQASGRNIAAAEMAAGVTHHVTLSVVGTDRLLQSGYFRAKLAQEEIVKASGIPYTIVRSTQFLEFLDSIAQSAGDAQAVRLSDALIQPIASDDVAVAVCNCVVEPPVNGVVEIAGPERWPLSDLVRRYLQLGNDSRRVFDDPGALYFGATLERETLIPAQAQYHGKTTFNDWLEQSRLDDKSVS